MEAFLGMIFNAALLLALGVVHSMLFLEGRGSSLFRNVLTGLLLGLTGLAVMMNPWQAASGVVFDTRSILLGISGLFFGMVPTVVATVITGAYRAFLGGAGLLMGLGVIVTSSLIGLVWHRVRQMWFSDFGWVELYVFGVAIHFAMLLWTAALPLDVRVMVRETIAVSVMIIYPVGTVLLGMLLAHQQVRVAAQVAIAHKLKELEALHDIDQSITSSLDLAQTVKLILEKAVSTLAVDAACLFIVRAEKGILDCTAGIGLKSHALKSVRFGESVVGKVALSGERVVIQSRAEAPDSEVLLFMEEEGIHSIVSIPLVNQGKVTGVLEVYLRKNETLFAERLNFMEILAGQAAIAVEYARLYNDLQQSNQELVQAYDATIDGWSTTMDLRDRETVGHSRRVAELTLKLAVGMGMDEGDLVHTWRGALLHDIGKMVIPDAVLLKEGKLSEEEWVIMRKHPQVAYDLLSGIDYLVPAMTIPFCHHERWDGSGYPRGLKGEDIPLDARIFAVVDVYDALTNDRPYRKAWTKEKALQYIDENGGILFDPQVVSLFLAVMGTGPLTTKG